MIAHQLLNTLSSAIFFTTIALAIRANHYPLLNNAYVYGLRSDYQELVGTGSSCDNIGKCMDVMCRIFSPNKAVAHLVIDPIRDEEIACGYPSIFSEPIGAFIFILSICLYISALVGLVLNSMHRDDAYKGLLCLCRGAAVGGSAVLLMSNLISTDPIIPEMGRWPYLLHLVFAIVSFIAEARASNPVGIETGTEQL